MVDQRIQYTEEMVGAGHPTKSDTLNRGLLIEHENEGTHSAETLSSAISSASSKSSLADGDSIGIVDSEDSDTPKSISGSDLKSSLSTVSASNLKPVVNASVNKLDIFTKSGGTVPDTSDFFYIPIPDGNGNTTRTRKATYLSGTSQIILADAIDYWSKGDLADEIKTAWLYAIWDGTGIVWALSGYSGFNKVPTTTTVGDDDYFLLEDGSTYTRDSSHYCVPVIKIRYEYNTSDSPDHTIQSTADNYPEIIFTPKSDYGGQENLSSSVISGGDITEGSYLNRVVKQSGRYYISGKAQANASATATTMSASIRTGSATFGSAVIQSSTLIGLGISGAYATSTGIANVYLNAGDTIHLGVGVSGAGTRTIYGGSKQTQLTFNRVD